MFVNASNNAVAKLSSNINSSQTSLTVDDASVFPDAPFLITVNEEIMRVTRVSSNSLTVQRAREGTSASSHNAGSNVENNFTAGTYQALVEEIKERVYIEDEKTINRIKYKKYSDRKIEIKGKVDLNNVTVSTSIGDIYRSDNIELTMIDESDIKELYYCNFWPMKPTTFNYWVGTSSGSLGDFSFRVYAPTDRGNTDITIGVYAIGRWK